MGQTDETQLVDKIDPEHTLTLERSLWKKIFCALRHSDTKIPDTTNFWGSVHSLERQLAVQISEQGAEHATPAGQTADRAPETETPDSANPVGQPASPTAE